MADIFQQVFNATNMDCFTLPVRSYGYNNPDNYLPNDHFNISGCSHLFVLCISVADLVIMEGCNKFCRWRKIGMLSS